MPTSRSLLIRLHRDERGFALVTAIILLSVMTMLMVVSLSAGESAFRISERGARWNRTLVIAEQGVNDAVTRLGQSRTSASPCAIGTSQTCSSNDGEYQVDWSTVANGTVVITSIGYFPALADADVSRKLEVTYSPIPVFRYSLFSSETLDIKNGEVVVGDVYATSGVTVGNVATVCGSIQSASGNVTIGNSNIVKSYVDANHDCSGKTGDVWAGGSIGTAGTIQGNAIAAGPSGFVCNPASRSYQLTGIGTVAGNATACGRITASVSGVSSPGTSSDQPAVQTLPEFVFDPDNYLDLTCYPGPVSACAATNTSATAVSSFNAVCCNGMSGTHAIWQSLPSKSTYVNLEGLDLTGDTTIITNAPVYFGNAPSPDITSTVPATLVVISLYVPPVGTTCDSNNLGDCSIYGKNAVVFDDGGTPSDLTDGVAGLLYTPGKMAFKNSANAADGALYAGSMDIKNGFEITYSGRIERTLGFGNALEQTLWQELPAS